MAKVRNVRILYKPLRAIASAEVRLHRTVLYNSIYRADSQLLVNMHVYGVPAYSAPVLHLRKIAGGKSRPRIWTASSTSGTPPPQPRRTSDGPPDRLMRRPRSPPANSLVPSANVIVANDAGHILMIKRSDNDNWAIPGGAMDLGESLSQTAIRETREETGIDCEITGLVGIYTDPKHVILYTSDGEVRQEFSVVFTARAVAGIPTPSSESTEVIWKDPAGLAELPMDRSMRKRINHYLGQADRPYLG